MIKILLKYLFWAGVAGAVTAMAVNIYFNGFIDLFFAFPYTGVAGAIVGFVGGVVGYLLGLLSGHPYKFGMFAAVIVGGVAGFFVFLFSCGLGC